MAEERRPAIVAVDDEPAVLAAVARDLRRGFGERYRIVRAGSGRGGARRAEASCARRGDQVALLIADQRMPGMAGTEYLVEARKLVPDAKRVLLTAYADTEAAIAAINEVALDYYLLKPWDPPEEQLFPVVEDLLDDVGGRAPRSRPAACASIGHRFSRDSHDLRDFLARNRVPGALARRRARRRGARAAAGRGRRAPTGCRSRCSRTAPCSSARPCSSSPSASAWPAQPAPDHYDLVIVGGGPAGLARRRLRRLRGAAHGDGRARGARRPGRPVEPDRELPRLPDRPERLRPRAPRDRPGAPPRRRAAHRAGRRRPARRGRRPRRRAQRRRRAERELRARRLRRLLPPARRARASRSSPARASTTARR